VQVLHGSRKSQVAWVFVHSKHDFTEFEVSA